MGVERMEKSGQKILSRSKSEGSIFRQNSEEKFDSHVSLSLYNISIEIR